MTDATASSKTDAVNAKNTEGERATTAAWLAGVSAVFGFLTLSGTTTEISIGAAIAFVALSGMVTATCYFILRSGRG